MRVVDFEGGEWDAALGKAVAHFLLDNGQIISLHTTLGRGYWKRAVEMLEGYHGGEPIEVPDSLRALMEAT